MIRTASESALNRIKAARGAGPRATSKKEGQQQEQQTETIQQRWGKLKYPPVRVVVPPVYQRRARRMERELRDGAKTERGSGHGGRGRQARHKKGSQTARDSSAIRDA